MSKRAYPIYIIRKEILEGKLKGQIYKEFTRKECILNKEYSPQNATSYKVISIEEHKPYKIGLVEKRRIRRENILNQIIGVT
jgi:hypothetical protein